MADKLLKMFCLNVTLNLFSICITFSAVGKTKIRLVKTGMMYFFPVILKDK